MRDEGLPRMSDEMILETEGLTKEFAGFVAVNGVSLRVKRGTIHALIGPNGAGKTTCFNLLTKFLSPTRGRILFKGNDITAMQPADVAAQRLERTRHDADRRCQLVFGGRLAGSRTSLRPQARPGNRHDLGTRS